MIFRWGSQMLRSASPLTLFIGGAAAVMMIPAIRRGLRSIAVSAAAGALTVVDGIRNAGETVHQEMHSIVSEARSSRLPDGLEATTVDIGPDSR